MPRVRHLIALTISAALACGDADGPGQQFGEGWSGTPAAEPVEIGMPCDNEWFICVEGAFCDTVDRDFVAPRCSNIGVCAAIPDTCEPGPPRCGCDGQRYESACVAAMAGISAVGATGCEPPPGHLNCGDEFCDLETHYCKHILAHGMGETWACIPFDCPDALVGCACITAPSPCGDPAVYDGQNCEPTPEGGALLTCLSF